MSFVTVRGGVPYAVRTAVTQTGEMRRFPAPSRSLVFRVGPGPSVDLKVYFSEADFDADTNYMTIPAGSEVEYPIEMPAVWLKATGITPVVSDLELYAFMRRT